MKETCYHRGLIIICTVRQRGGKHTADGFRKLRVIHRPEYYLPRDENRGEIINKSVKQGYISSSTFLATTQVINMYSNVNQSLKTGLGTQGPSEIIEREGTTLELVTCFYVKTWPKEAESWFTRQTHWPDRKLKSKIRKKGYLLVPTGNRQSEESDLEWRCSFSIAEKNLFQSMTKFQRYTFILFKVLLKEYLPSDINTNGDKQLLSTYHLKTLFLWSLEDSKLKWEPEHMLDNIGHILDKLLIWIKRQYFPHYFIQTVNLLDGRLHHGRTNLLICFIFISAIRKDMSNKIKQSQFFIGQESDLSVNSIDIFVLCINIQNYLMQYITGELEHKFIYEVYRKMNLLRQFKFRNSVLVENLISFEHDIDPQMQHLYRALYNDPVHDKLLTEVVPGHIDRYRGCLHLAKYCMAARDGRVLQDVLHTSESLLKDTLHLDPCSGYIKLACLFIVTGDFVHAMDQLNVAENNFLFIHKRMKLSDLKALQYQSTEVYTILVHEVFQKWVKGQITSDIVVTWPEYITAPDLLQFELIHESTQQILDLPYIWVPGMRIKLDCHLQWPPLIMIKLLKFVCASNSGQASKRHMEHLVTDLIISSLSLTGLRGINCIYTVFNMAAWCYVKIEKYKSAANMMTVAIVTSSQTQTMKRCAFSHQFVAYVIGQCLQ